MIKIISTNALALKFFLEPQKINMYIKAPPHV
jgi:hypothetical protein